MDKFDFNNIVLGFILGVFCYIFISAIASAEKPKETPYQDRALKAINESLKRIELKLSNINASIDIGTAATKYNHRY